MSLGSFWTTRLKLPWGDSKLTISSPRELLDKFLNCPCKTSRIMHGVEASARPNLVIIINVKFASAKYSH